MHRNTIFVLAVIILACSSSGNRIAAQNVWNDLRRAPGRLISEGHNTTPVGPTKLLTYKLEELDLPQPREMVFRGRKHLVTTVLRLTIRGQQHQPSSMIWIDDVLYPSPWELDATSTATFIYDVSRLRDGAQYLSPHTVEFMTYPSRSSCHPTSRRPKRKFQPEVASSLYNQF